MPMTLSNSRINDYLGAYSSEEIHRRVNDAWEFQEGFLPVPKFDLSCPDCGSKQMYYYQLSQGRKKDTPNPYRMDAQFICSECFHKITKGLMVSEEVFDSCRHAINRGAIKECELRNYIEENYEA